MDHLNPPGRLPLISVLTPTYNTDPVMLREMFDSVLAQDYPYWQLCVVDDASTDQGTLDVLRHYGTVDERIRIRLRDSNGNICVASNDALSMASGDYVGLLDHDDVLHPDALGAVAHQIFLDPGLDYLYTDEDKLYEDGTRRDAFLKPGWSPELLLAQMYCTHFSVYRRRLVTEVGGFREGFEGAQDWDLCLRVTERTDRIFHLPRVLYSWRMHAQSTAASIDAKPYAIAAGHRAIEEALVRRHVNGVVIDDAIGGQFHVDRTPAENPLVTAVIPTAGGFREVRGERIRLVDRAIHSLARNDYDNWEAVVVLSDGTDPDLPGDLEAIAPGRLTFVHREGAFDFSHATNLGAVHGRGEVLLFLNDDIEAIDPAWLRRMVGWLDDPGIGAVGAKLWFEDDTVQHAGVIAIDGSPAHAWRRWDSSPGYFAELILSKNYLAVTAACMVTRRADFEAVGGMSELFPINFNDVDYCLKLRRRGLRIVYEPLAELYHYESSTRSGDVSLRELHLFHDMWGDITAHDPYWKRTRYETLNPLLARH